MRVRKAKRNEWQLSFASMSDIAFLLIIFFVVAGKFAQTSEKDVVLPAITLGERAEPRDIELVVTKDGEYYVNGSRVQPEQLEAEIQSYLLADMAPEARTVVLHADRDTEYGTVAKAIDAINQADAYLELAVLYND